MYKIVDFLDLLVHEELAVAQAADRAALLSLRLRIEPRFVHTLLIA